MTSAAPVPGWQTSLLRWSLRAAFGTLTRTSVVGASNVPAAGPCILAYNHAGHLDGPLLLATAPRADLSPIAAGDLPYGAVERWLIGRAGTVWIERGASDRDALETALRLLSAGRAVAIAPEGRISRDGRMGPGQPGTAFIALRSGAPVIPVAIQGTAQAIELLKRGRRPTLRVAFGPPVPMPAGSGKASREQATAAIMAAIASMLPEDLRGRHGSGADGP